MHTDRIRLYAVVLFVSAVLWPCMAQAATWYVGKRGASGSARCARPDHVTIQAAIDGASSGDVIVICAGVYVEQPVVRTKSLHLRGLPGASVSAPRDGRGPVVLFAGPQRSMLEGLRVSGADALAVNVGIRADGFDFDDHAPPGDSRTVLTVLMNHVVDIAGVGIFLEEADGAVIANVLEHYATAGIVVDGNQTGGQVEITANALRGDRTRRPSQRGIVLDECDASVRANHIANHQGSDPEQTSAGLWVEFARVSARQNVLSDNHVGIQLAPGSGSQIECNVIVGTEQDGVALLRTQLGQVAHNRLRAIGGDGIVLSAAQESSLVGNDMEGCGGAGLRLSADAVHNRLLRNVSLANGAFDLLDEAPPGANEHLHNQCEESSPHGLCE